MIPPIIADTSLLETTGTTHVVPVVGWGVYLLRHLGGAGFADNLHFDLTGVLHGLLDLAGHITGQLQRLQVIDHIRTHQDTHFTTRTSRPAWSA